jgi:hypothetical protein
MKFILTTPAELARVIEGTIRKIHAETTIKEGSSPHEFLNIEQASEFLNLSKQTLCSYTSTNRIPFIKRSKKLYFQRSILEKWLLEGRKKSNYEIEQEINRKS